MTPQGMTSYRNEFASECFYCGKIGHITKFCRKKKANQERYNQKRHAGHLADADADTDPDQNPDVRLFMAEGDTAIEEDESDIWILDSRASSHMSGKKQWFRNFKESNTGAKVYLGDNSGYEIKGHGDVLVTLPDGKIRNISDVWYVPGIKKNLISVSKITDQDLKVEFFKSYCIIKDLLDQMKPIATGIHIGGLYKLDVKSTPQQALMTSNKSANEHGLYKLAQEINTPEVSSICEDGNESAFVDIKPVDDVVKAKPVDTPIEVDGGTNDCYKTEDGAGQFDKQLSALESYLGLSKYSIAKANLCIEDAGRSAGSFPDEQCFLEQWILGDLTNSGKNAPAGGLQYNENLWHRGPLDWTTRMKIALGAVRGLTFIHHSCKSPKLAHGNIKSSNVLSDKSGNACISDFGPAASRAAGYRAPEQAKTRKISQKAVGFLDGCEEHIMISGHPDTDDAAPYEIPDEEAVAMIEESPTNVAMLSSPGANDCGHGASSWSMDCSTIVKVRTIHISSAILAAKSPFFYKLFSNGMRESEQRDVTLRISASEEAALMELLNFMYSGTVTTNTASALLDVLMAADKFEVASCMRHCSRLLRNLSMTPESALLYLELPSSVLMADAVQPLTDAAKQYLAKQFRDITKFQEEVMALPLAGVEAVLSSDELQVASEDAVYDFVLKWARAHYPKIEDRRDILGSRLGRLIRFPNMSSRKLKKVLSCSDFDHELASKVVLDALFFKAETPHRQRSLAAEETSHKRFSERAYKYRPVKMVEFTMPHQQCIVFLDLKRAECAGLFPSGRVYSQAFHLGGQGFFLSAHCNMDQHSAFHCFGLFLGMQEKGSVSFAVEYEFATRSKPSSEFAVKYKGNYTFTGGKAVGYRNLFQTPWSSFMADDSPYFIKDTLHLRAELTIKPQ